MMIPMPTYTWDAAGRLEEIELSGTSTGDTSKVNDIKEDEKFMNCRNKKKRKNKRSFLYGKTSF